MITAVAGLWLCAAQYYFYSNTYMCPPPGLHFSGLNWVLKVFWRISLLLDLWQWSRNCLKLTSITKSTGFGIHIQSSPSLSLSVSLSYVVLYFQSGAAAGESWSSWSASSASGLFSSNDLQCLGEQFLNSHCCMSLIRILTKPRVQMILITFHYGPTGPGILLLPVPSLEDAPEAFNRTYYALLCNAAVWARKRSAKLQTTKSTPKGIIQ